MKLGKVTINHYMCLKDVTLSFGDLTILVGKNGSGKTSILEALYRFFTDFSIIGGGVPSGLIDYYWFNRDTGEPIRISVELELTEDEFENFSNFFLKLYVMLLKTSQIKRVFYYLSRDKLSRPKSDGRQNI